ncbi:hypothetical protein BDA96_01G564200 [Sorghum bicolor]|uniref:Uncharacterized protein n=1 Tax=Sorghum bicolor TaxID=4558 RepID=A0A921V381_SORBI|nr:hypothetical protein BDA96_01G564200 [Sorghum bicolor]
MPDESAAVRRPHHACSPSAHPRVLAARSPPSASTCSPSRKGRPSASTRSPLPKGRRGAGTSTPRLRPRALAVCLPPHALASRSFPSARPRVLAARSPPCAPKQTPSPMRCSDVETDSELGRSGA